MPATTRPAPAKTTRPAAPAKVAKAGGKAPEPPAGNGLVGQFFHSIGGDGKVNWQGYVCSTPEPGWYLVQLFEWGMGEPNVRRLMRIEQMESWLFYADADEMKFSWEDGVARPGGRYR